MFIVKCMTTLLFVLALSVSAACGPSDAELAALVEAEVAKQVALIPPAPQGETGPDGAEGPQGVQGPQGAVGPQGPQGLTGPQGPQGATGPQGRVGPAGPVGVQGPKGETGPQGPAGSPAEIPSRLEVEELVVRGSTDGWYLVLRAGTDESVASIEWYGPDGTQYGEIVAGTTFGMVLSERNNDRSWTSVCIVENTYGLCAQ